MRIIIVFLLCLCALGFRIPLVKETQVSSFDISMARTYVAYGVLSYCPKKCLEDWSCQFSKNYPKLINVTHVNNEVTLAAAYIGYEPISKTVVISWRGSNNAQNWIEDFTF